MKCISEHASLASPQLAWSLRGGTRTLAGTKSRWGKTDRGEQRVEQVPCCGQEVNKEVGSAQFASIMPETCVDHSNTSFTQVVLTAGALTVWHGWTRTDGDTTRHVRGRQSQRDSCSPDWRWNWPIGLSFTAPVSQALSPGYPTHQNDPELHQTCLRFKLIWTRAATDRHQLATVNIPACDTNTGYHLSLHSVPDFSLTDPYRNIRAKNSLGGLWD